MYAERRSDSDRFVLLLVQFATEAAITILRIDDMIRIQANPEEDPED